MFNLLTALSHTLPDVHIKGPTSEL